MDRLAPGACCKESEARASRAVAAKETRFELVSRVMQSSVCGERCARWRGSMEMRHLVVSRRCGTELWKMPGENGERRTRLCVCDL